MKSSLTLLQSYINNNNVNINIEDFIKEPEFSNTGLINISESLFDNIIVDAYNGFSEEVKLISNFISSEYNIFFGRKEKIIIKEVLDYEDSNKISEIEKNIKDKFDLKETILKYRRNNLDHISKSKTEYFKNLKKAIENNDRKRITDYLNFLYSRMLEFNEYKFKSVSSIFEENRLYLIKDFDVQKVNQFRQKCELHQTAIPYNDAVDLYKEIYFKELIDGGKEYYDVVNLCIDQNLYDKFNDKNDFYSYIFELLRLIYSKIKNHRTLILKIENIISNELNIKWEIYSYLILFSENFKCYQEDRIYFKPDQICFDYLHHKYNLKDNNINKDALKQYFQNKITFQEIKNITQLDISISEFDFFKNVSSGFQFNDCLILSSDKIHPNTKELSFIKNQTEILLVFTKNEIDDRKIPCPVCASSKISGNSYPEVGIKSWECKNSFCSERSKTNRGKRYSRRSVDMQNGLSKNIDSNTIDKDLISKWRKDVVPYPSYDTLHEMVIRYFSYHNGKVLIINYEIDETTISKKLYSSRKIEFVNYIDLLDVKSFNKGEFQAFFEHDLFNKFIYKSNLLKQSKETRDLSSIKEYEIYNENCLSFLTRVPKNSIHHMVTSPPYYNAREYSQWQNLYNYLNDMYNICIASFEVLKPGCVFFYNIGDIFDNPNTIVKSKMGERRVALGAYLIYLFQKAGFELLDNIIWDKGETQSNRHKNDGNFTPYYQRPANCYEHMFVFKKPGNALIVNNNKFIKNNVVKFSPVIKINSRGENTYGHTAPYPSELPLLSIEAFTHKNDIVFDPFLGSGTTVYTAVKNNRIGIGTEIDKEYYKLAKSVIKKNIMSNTQMTLNLE